MKKVLMSLFIVFIVVGCANIDSRGFNNETRINQETKTYYDVAGYDYNGYDKFGYDQMGYNYSGYDKNGYNKRGYNKEGYDEFGYDQNGYDYRGYDKSNTFSLEAFKIRQTDVVGNLYEYYNKIKEKLYKSQFETEQEYLKRITPYKNELDKIYVYNIEYDEKGYNYGISYDILKEQWNVEIKFELYGEKGNSYSGDFFEINSNQKIKFNFNMNKEEVQSNKNIVIQILYSLDNLNHLTYTYRRKWDDRIRCGINVKLKGIVVWNKDRTKLLHYEKYE